MPSLVWVNQFALLPRDGGGTRHFELGRELARKGWQVTILACDFHLHSRRFTRRAGADDRRTHVETHDNVTIRWLWAAPYERNDWRRALNWWTFYRSVLREGRELAKSGAAPDVVIGSSPQLFAAVAGRALARRAKSRFVFEVRDLWPESLLAVGGRRGVLYRILERVAAGLYDAADRILVLARGSGAYLIERGIPARKIVHVPNGVDVDAIRPAGETRSAAPGQLTAIYAGAHGPANGLERVLDAAEIIGAAAGVRFVLIGDGPAKAGLVASAQLRGLTQVEFLNPVAKDALAGVLANADVGLMVLREAPLFSYGVSPNKLFDYLAAGLPVVCNVPGEVADMLSDSGAGVQAIDSSGGALADAIRKIHALPLAERRDLGTAGRSWVEREHGRGVLGQRLDAFLREILSQ
jgi:glycosyltransferase involved in cell wall biosynthesis